MSLDVAIEQPDTPEAQTLLAELDNYLNSLYPPHAQHGLDLAQLLAPSVTFFVARIDGAAVGCAAIVIAGDEAELKRFYVRPGARRQGVGRALMDARLAYACEAGVRVARIESGIHQPEALAFFVQYGFERTGPFGDYQENGLSVFFRKSIH